MNDRAFGQNDSAVADATSAEARWSFPDRQDAGERCTFSASDLRPSGERSLPGLGQCALSHATQAREGVHLTWQRAQSVDARTAWRLVIRNASSSTIAVGDLAPLILSHDWPPFASDRWTALRSPRLKNDLPSLWSLDDEGAAAWDAFKGMPETGGARAERGAKVPSTMLSSELVGLAGSSGVALTLGVAPCHRQLVTSYVERGPNGTVSTCGVRLHGDGAHVLPSGEWESQWVVFQMGDDLATLCEDYAALLRAWYPETAARRDRQHAPSVWCSWYFYGDGCEQREVAEDLEYLRTSALPIDVVQIDECWDDRWGDWNPAARWPDIDRFAERIKSAGFRPGLWTCAFLCEQRASLGYRHPEWLLHDRDGKLIRFAMNGMNNLVLDPTHPEVLRHLEALYHRLTHEWGFTYHKIDFTRAVAHPEARFHDPSCTRAEAYRRGLEAVRRGIGDGAYLNICGGLYGPSIGIADAQRTGSDVRSTWPSTPADEDPDAPYGPFAIKQNTLRWWMNRLWANDGDALMVRRRSEPYMRGHLSLGSLTDDEAETFALNQYLAGGLACVSERMSEVDEDRLLLWRRCVPAIGTAARPLGLTDGARYPDRFRTQVRGRAVELGEWTTVAIVNWYAEPREVSVALTPDVTGVADGDLVVGSFHAKWHRRVRCGDTVRVALPPHGCDVLRVQPATDNSPQLLATDGHLGMGVELSDWHWDGETLRLAANWQWACPLCLWIAAPRDRCFHDGRRVAVVTIHDSSTHLLTTQRVT